MAAFHSTKTITARGVETAAIQPAISESPAEAVIASNTTCLRPQRCAVSFPATETSTPAKPANVKSTVGSGSHGGDPCQAITVAKNVTAQALTAAISQVCTVYPAIQAIAARLRNTGR